MKQFDSRSADAIVIGAGIVGACSALSLTNAGLKVIVIDRGTVASGTTGAGEGNILVSDKDPGPELTLALRSRDLWFEMQEDVGDSFELEAKGGVVVARGDDSQLMKLADSQSIHGVTTEKLDHRRLHELEPFLHPDLSSGVFYPQDAQCQPMLAAAKIIQKVISRGGQLVTQSKVLGFDIVDGAMKAVITSTGKYQAPIVINAAGTWAGDIALMAGSTLPVAPRRGFILVTEPAPQYIFHKVYDSDYVTNVASSDAELQTSTVVEGTRSGTILIGASRERVGFDGAMNYDIVRKLADQATSLFPILRDVQLLRVYKGFRPYAPDHLPLIGEDHLIKGLWHSAGHEGAGIGLAPGSAALITDSILGRASFMDPSSFSPKRFSEVLV